MKTVNSSKKFLKVLLLSSAMGTVPTQGVGGNVLGKKIIPAVRKATGDLVMGIEKNASLAFQLQKGLVQNSSLAFQQEISNLVFPYMVTPSTRTLKLPISFSYYEPTVQQQIEMYDEFKETFLEGLEEIKSWHTLAYYQRGPQARLISPSEIASRMLRLQEAYQKNIAQRQLLNAPNPDQNLLIDELKRGMLYFYALGSGQMVSFELEKENLRGAPRFDRAFSEKEFFLHIPSSYTGDYWPITLKVAAINDSTLAREAFYQLLSMQQTRNWQVDVFTNAEDFLSSSDCLSYDLVLTDLLIPNGGGMFLGTKLRARGYEKTILAVSAFGEIKEFGISLWDKGFDGMISTSNVNVYTPQYLYLILDKLNNYFYYLSTKKWAH